MVTQTRPTKYNANNATMPGQDGFAVTPSNITNFDTTARALYIGLGGDVTLVTPMGNVITFINTVTGSIIPIMCNRVNATGTTATNIVAIL